MCQHKLCSWVERKMLTAELSKAARAMLGWTSARLSEESEVPHDTIRAFESGRTQQLTKMNEKAIIKAFVKNGLDFIPENGGGAGIRFKKRKGTG